MAQITLPLNYRNQVYAGWLGKCIGVHFGGPIEGWTYDEIATTLGEVTHYLQDGEKIFKPDDDLAMPLIMMQALAGVEDPDSITAETIGDTWLNFLSREGGGIWRGGYGISSEHTAYINLTHGIMPPKSGSAEFNGLSISEQIGGQIFSDIWGLVLPNNCEAAADLSEKAASISHDGEGINGARFVAALVSAAFVENDPQKLINRALDVIPSDSKYAQMVSDLIDFYHAHSQDWREARTYVEKYYGYQHYSGAVPIIPNAAVIIIGLLYGRGKFTDSIVITNNCGWDTDCNAGNVGAIIGVACELEGIEARWRLPIQDFVVSSTVIGVHNIARVPETADFLADCGERFTEKRTKTTQPYGIHFNYPNSNYGFKGQGEHCQQVLVKQSGDRAMIGEGSLAVIINKLMWLGFAQASMRTYLWTDELRSNFYKACFSPQLYPGQTVTANIYLPTTSGASLMANLFVKDRATNAHLAGQSTNLMPGEWCELTFKIPSHKNLTISDLGVQIRTLEETPWSGKVYLDGISWNKQADIELDLTLLPMDADHLTQFTTYTGFWRKEQDAYCGSGVKYNETYTGDPGWQNYALSVNFKPVTGDQHFILMRVQGGMQGYAMGLMENNKAGILKKVHGSYQTLAITDFIWEKQISYKITGLAKGNELFLSINGKPVLSCIDSVKPLLNGLIGLGNGPGCMTRYFYLDYKGV